MFYKEVFLRFVDNSSLKACFAALLYRRETRIRTETIRRSGQFYFSFVLFYLIQVELLQFLVQVITSLDSPGT